MKTTKPNQLKLFAALIGVAALSMGGLYAYFELPPVSLRSNVIPGDFLRSLQAQSEEDLRDPLRVSLLLLYWGASDPIDTTGMSIGVTTEADGTRTVKIDDRYVEDDSISRSYSLIRLRRHGTTWMPFEWATARQGRGVFGWTTGPTK